MQTSNLWKYCAVAVIGCLVIGCVIVLSQYRKAQMEAYWSERDRKDNHIWKEIIDEVTSGKSDAIAILYGGSPDIDNQLRDMASLKNLRKLCLEDVDVTPDRLAALAKIPQLKEIHLYGGIHLLSNQDFEILNGNMSIQQMVLVYKDKRQIPLPSLKKLTNLRELTIFDRERASPDLTEDDWYWLGELHQLKQLRIGGAGVTEGCIRHLREAMPHTSVVLLKKEPGTR